LLERILTEVVGDFHDLTSPERDNFRTRTADLVSDDVKLKPVTIVFDGDQQHRPFPVLDETGVPSRTDLNGAIDGTIRLPTALGDELLASQPSTNGWLSFHTDQGAPGRGSVQLLEPKGDSVISDIDDTIKITEIPAGVEIVTRNTFFRDFVAVEGMAEKYRGLGASSFHYVSGAPWQLYGPEANFLINIAGFPSGSFHLKTLDRNLLSRATWESLEELAADRFDTKVITFKQKVLQITQLLTNLSGRKFRLFGDSGERDPEVYRLLRNEFPQSIREIYIRDVVDDRANKTGRLEGMKIIEAPTIVRGRSQFAPRS
jgi:phosphatidate phosphatase APP1